MTRSLNDLPTIIDSPGVYRDRAGRRVVVHAIAYVDERGQPTTAQKTLAKGYTAFPAKGTTEYKAPDRNEANAWHVSGRLVPHTQTRRDIVRKVRSTF